MGIDGGPMVLIMAGKTEEDIAAQLAPAGGFIANPRPVTGEGGQE